MPGGQRTNGEESDLSDCITEICLLENTSLIEDAPLPRSSPLAKRF